MTFDLSVVRSGAACFQQMGRLRPAQRRSGGGSTHMLVSWGRGRGQQYQQTSARNLRGGSDTLPTPLTRTFISGSFWASGHVTSGVT